MPHGSLTIRLLPCPVMSKVYDGWAMSQPAAADRGLARYYASASVFALGNKLTVFGIRISPILRRENIPFARCAGSPKLISYLRDYVARNRVYKPTGTTGFQAFFRVLIQQSGPMRANELLARVQGIWDRFIHEEAAKRPADTKVYRVFLKWILGTRRSYDYSRLRQLHSVPGCETMWQSLLSKPEDFLRYLLEALLPGHDASSTIFTLANSDANMLLAISDLAAVRAAEGMWRFAETESGHLGLAPKFTEPGDVVCVIRGSSHPVILRPAGDKFVHVGVCWMLGLMDGEGAESLGESLEKFEIV